MGAPGAVGTSRSSSLAPPVLVERPLLPLRRRPLALEPPAGRAPESSSRCWPRPRGSTSPSAAGTATGSRRPTQRRCPHRRSSSRGRRSPRRPRTSAFRPSRPRTRPGSRAPTRSPTRPPSRSPSIRRPAPRPGPNAVTLVDAGDWAAGVAAASLVAAPVGAPRAGHRVRRAAGADRGGAPRARPRGLGGDRRARRSSSIGSAAAPEGYETLEVEGADAAELAAEIDQLRERLAGEPEAHRRRQRRRARVRDAGRRLGGALGRPGAVRRSETRCPEATVKALRRHDGVPVYVLGPEDGDQRADDEGDRAHRPERRAGRGRGPGRERDRLRPLRRRRASAGTSTTPATAS